jgi:hypothetical protein
MNETIDIQDANSPLILQPLSMSALLENRGQTEKLKSLMNKPSTQAELIALTRRLWRLYDNIFDEGKHISASQHEHKTEALHDIRVTRQLLREEINQQSIDEALITEIEQRLKTLYKRDITDTTVKFDLSGKSVAAMKLMLQILEKNYKIHFDVMIEIMRLPNPAAAFTHLFNIIIETSDSSEADSIIKALTEILHNKNLNGYASTALNENLTITEALKQKLGPVKKYENFLEAIAHAQALEAQQIFNCNYLPLDAQNDQEEIYIPQQGNIGLDIAFSDVAQQAAKAANPIANTWSSIKRFIKQHKALTAICIGLIVLGMAAVAVMGSIVGFGLAAIATGVLKTQYDKKTAQWQSETCSNEFYVEVRDPLPMNTPVFTDLCAKTPSASVQKAAAAPVAVMADQEGEGEGEARAPHM